MKKIFKFKNYTFPSGKIVKIQGYEDRTIDYLLKIRYKEKDLLVGNDVPKIHYNFKGKDRRYFPDLLIKSENMIVETKSLFTFRKHLPMNLVKRQACLELEYRYVFIIHDDNLGMFII